MAMAAEVDFARACKPTAISPDVYFVAPDGRTQTVTQCGESGIVIETRGLIGEFLFGPNGAYKDVKPSA
jgi:hypothetical protein